MATGLHVERARVSTSTILAGAAGESALACSLLDISDVIAHDRSLGSNTVTALLFLHFSCNLISGVEENNCTTEGFSFRFSPNRKKLWV